MGDFFSGFFSSGYFLGAIVGISIGYRKRNTFCTSTHLGLTAIPIINLLYCLKVEIEKIYRAITYLEDRVYLSGNLSRTETSPTILETLDISESRLIGSLVCCALIFGIAAWTKSKAPSPTFPQ